MSDSVIIVGGGLAGLAAAAGLAVHGVQSVVLESRPRLGGRASSFQDAGSGEFVDNCQHVAMGCCTNFLHFCRLTGLAPYFRTAECLHFIGPDGRDHRFAADRLPAPLHLARAFAGLSYLGWSDKLALALGLRALADPAAGVEHGETFAAWLERHRQPPRAVRRFWEVVLVSALSETLDRISVPIARKVFVDSFLTNANGWTVEIPTVPLDDLYSGPLLQWLIGQGVEVRVSTGVERVHVADDGTPSVELRSGERLVAKDAIVAVPFFRVLDLLPPVLADDPAIRGVSELEAAPITSVHLWFDRPVTDLPHAVFVDRLVQWVFQRERPAVEGSPRSWYCQVVISASRMLAGQSQADVLRQVLAELSQVWPAVAQAALLHSRQVTERRAVFSPLPGSEALRPAQQTLVPGIQLSGDWTQTGWPATMEGAVRSGYLAAENILRRRGQSGLLLQPDLPVSPLSRALLPICDPDLADKRS